MARSSRRGRGGKTRGGGRGGKNSSGGRAAKVEEKAPEVVAAKVEDKMKNTLSDAIQVHSNTTAEMLQDNSRDIKVDNFSLLFHGNHLIHEQSLSLNYGRRYGLIGYNGCGKSTLLNALGGGLIPFPANITMFHVSKEVPASDITALEAVMEVDDVRNTLEAEAERLSELAGEDESALDMLNDVYEQLEALDSDTAEARAASLLSGLQFSNDMQNTPTKAFSGGWRMRVALARALFLNPSFLLLDGPTAHLDMEAVVWLEEYLKTFQGILLMVSHSQDFMNNVCTDIIRMHEQSLKYFTGNFDTYVSTRKDQEGQQMKKYNWEQEQIASMKQYIARFGHGNAKMARQAQSKEKILAKMEREGLTPAVEKDKRISFNFLPCEKLPTPVIQFNHVDFAYPGSIKLYDNLEVGVAMEDRICLVGANGCGKTTLLKLMTGMLEPTDGHIKRNSHLKMARYTQHFADVLDMDKSPLQFMMDTYPDTTRDDMRAVLGRYGVTGEVQLRDMSQLSTGQNAGVLFAWIALQRPHLLLLDEPTNALSPEAINALAEAIKAFEGGVIIVSHDMRLISQVCTELWLCTGPGTSGQDGTQEPGNVEVYRGDILQYKAELLRKMSGRPSNVKKATVKRRSTLKRIK